MADGLAAGIVNAILNSVFNDAAFTAIGPVYIQLHVGAPGAAGTSNIATNNTRISAGANPAFTNPPTGGACSNTSVITWPSVSTTEVYTHWTAWTASSGGTFVGSGSVTGGSVTAGNDFVAPIGSLALSIPVAS